MIKFFIKLLATWFYAGLMPKAPGTWGSLLTFPLVYLLVTQKVNLGVLVLIILVLFLIGCLVSEKYDRLCNSHDNGQIVIDEVVGQLIAVLPVYVFYKDKIIWYMLAFIFFRFFDITKIMGIKFFDEKVRGGLGVMLDDVLAGIYAAIIILITSLGA